MKQLLWVILLIVLGATVTGCGGAHRYDSRLTAADSLMRSNPDSALALVEGIDRDSLIREGDRAYRDLLLTQARYRCYVPATSDSDINRALSYYCAHSGEREKLTRAYIYKGAVMEELGHPDSAMLYYKTAEATAAPDDYFNLGYTKMRIAYLYGQFFAMNGRDIQKYEESVECFSHTNDTNYQIISLNNLGCVYRDAQPKQAILTFNKAAALARMSNDTVSLVSIDKSLIVLYFYLQRYDKARQQIQETQKHRKVTTSDFGLLFVSAKVYARLGLMDSAMLFLNRAEKYEKKDDDLYRIYLLGALSEIALADNDTVSYLKYNLESERIADSLKSNQKKVELLNIETAFDKELIKKDLEKRNNIRCGLLTILVLTLLVLLFSILRNHYKAHRYDNIINELKRECKDQAHSFFKLQQNYNELSVNDNILKEFITTHIALMQDIIEECYHAPRNMLSKSIQHVIKFQKKNKDKWLKLYSYIDAENNNIITETRRNYPQLEEKDLLMIALTSLGYSCAQIAIILGYSNATSISTIRQRIANKMGIETSLIDYINQFSAS